MPRRRIFIIATTASIALFVTLSVTRATTGHERDSHILAFDDPAGQQQTLNVNGSVDFENPFFQDLGTNGRRCVTCHQPDQAWTITPARVRERFIASRGSDPLFRNNDGSNCEGDLESTQSAYSLLLTRGLIRVGQQVPDGAEFVIESVADPYNCGALLTGASMYRRPLPATNLRFLSAVMWDGRESSPTSAIHDDLMSQANDATLGHAQAAQPLTVKQREAIVDFETGLYTAQAIDNRAGGLRRDGSHGGPVALSTQRFHLGVNDPVGLDPAGVPFTTNVFTIFEAWETLPHHGGPEMTARRAIARGEKIFNSRTFTISGVGGLNGHTFPNGVTVPSSITGTCTVCHDTPNVGDHSVKAPLDIGVAAPGQAPYLPVYTLRNLTTGDRATTTDPGRAMITGKWADISKFKGPVLRALAARAPYFHNGSAPTLNDVIQFYDKRFTIGLTPGEKSDLLAFLGAL
jgi:hypothetical protein